MERKRAADRARYERNKDALRAKSKAYYEKNKAQIVARAKVNYRTWAKNNPCRVSELKKNYANVRRYGITPAQYDEMFRAQDGTCAICEQPPKKRGLCIDHDHSTGRVRQLLCVNCNAMLGHARDNAKVLARAIEYLRGWAAARAA